MGPARTQEDIQQSRMREINSNTAGLLAYYRLNGAESMSDNGNLDELFNQYLLASDAVLIDFSGQGECSNWSIGAPILHVDFNNNGIGDLCDDALITIETIEESSFGIDALFTNPSKGSANLHFLMPNNESIDIQLLDLMGRTLV